MDVMMPPMESIVFFFLSGDLPKGPPWETHRENTHSKRLGDIS